MSTKSRLLEQLGLAEEPAHLTEALTHRSYANECMRSSQGATEPPTDNERLEFLGDSVLGLCVSEALMQAFPGANEGELSRMRSAIVSEQALANFGEMLGVPETLLMGKGALASSENRRPSVVANAVEALVGAVYVDHGLDAAKAVVARLMASVRLDALQERDPKSLLQERAQATLHVTPTYAVEPAASGQGFVAHVRLGDRVLGQGQGASKKLAERAAARDALDRLPFVDALDSSSKERP